MHHLTYERLFREKDEDLLILCVSCHETVERGKDNGKIPRKGNPSALKSSTLSFLRPVPVSIPEKPSRCRNLGARNESQSQLIDDPRFSAGLEIDSREDFRAWFRKTFSKEERIKWSSNAFALFDRNKNGNLRIPPAHEPVPSTHISITQRHMEQVVKRGFLTKNQASILGFEWPPKKGWKHRAIGKAIPSEELDRLIFNLPPLFEQNGGME